MQAAWKDCLIRGSLTYGVFNISGFLCCKVTKVQLCVEGVPHIWTSTKHKCERLNTIFNNQLLTLTLEYTTGLPKDRWGKVYEHFSGILIWQTSTWVGYGLGDSKIEKKFLGCNTLLSFALLKAQVLSHAALLLARSQKRQAEFLSLSVSDSNASISCGFPSVSLLQSEHRNNCALHPETISRIPVPPV